MLLILSRIISLSTSVTPRFALLDNLPEDFLFIRLLSPAAFADCSAFAFLAALTATIPSKLVSLYVLSLVCPRPLLTGKCSLLVRLLVGVPPADVFLLLTLPLSYF